MSFETTPLEGAVFQRGPLNRAQISVAGTTSVPVVTVEARAVPRDGFSGTDSGWTVVAENIAAGGDFDGSLWVGSGWYDLQLRAWSASGQSLADQTVERVGVGEVFITAGQSNASNGGTETTTPSDERVVAYDANSGSWQFAADPQPVAGAFPFLEFGGSPWPSLGDKLVDLLDVPVGFLTTSVGGSAISGWAYCCPFGAGDLPSLYESNLKPAIEYVNARGGARAILFHQGESDSAFFLTPTADYRAALEFMIDRSRADGFDQPWAVAIASFYLYAFFPTDSLADLTYAPAGPAIAEAQAQAIDADPTVFQGANTDVLGAGIRPFDPGNLDPDATFVQVVHFDAQGLKIHGERWAASLIGQDLIPTLTPFPNYLTNGGFELGFEADWDDFDTAGLTADASEGEQAFVSSDNGGVYYGFDRGIPLAPGTYRVSFDAKSDGLLQRTFAGYVVAGESQQQEITLTAEWQLFSYEFTVQEASLVQVWFYGGFEFAGSFFIDNVVLTDVPPDACTLVDADADGSASFFDILSVLGSADGEAACPVGASCPADVNSDGSVNAEDVFRSILLLSECG
ncbi:MAG: sialate O-acetylesterase [Planctomycetota bacterium]